MSKKVAHWICVLQMLALPIGMWFTPNFVVWRFEIPISVSNPLYPVNVWVRILAVQVAVAMIVGFLQPIKRGPDGVALFGSTFGRSFMFALVGGIIGSFFIQPKVRVEVSISFQIFLSMIIAIFGGTQTFLIGLFMGTSLKETY